MSSLLQQLQALEVELHHPGVRCDRVRLEQLLHPDFQEVGRSGRQYTRSTVIAHFAAQLSHPRVVSNSFVLSHISQGTALLTYRSAQSEADGALTLHALRSSFWVNTAAGWQLRYHQGTPAAEMW